MAQRLVLEWTRTMLHAAVAEGRAATWRVRAIYAQPLSTTAETAQVLGALIKTAKLPTEEVITVVSREQVITRTVKFPTLDSAELTQMVELYAKAQLPYPREQTVMDFSVLHQQDGFSTVVVVACQRDVIDRQLGALRELKITPRFVTVSSWGVLGWYRHAVKSGAVKEPVLVINVDQTRTDLVLIANRHIISSRSVSQGAQDWASLSETAQLLALEAERSRSSIRKELPGTEIGSVILTGLGALDQWKEQMAQRLALPVTVVAAAAALPAVKTLPPACSPVIVGGVACADVRMLLNLSPSEVQGQVRHRQQVRELSLVGALLIAVFALGARALTLHVSRQRQTAAQLERVLKELGPTAKQVQEKGRVAQAVASILNDRRQLAAALAGMFRQTPATIRLDTVTFEASRRELIVRGNAPSTQVVLEYRKALEKVAGIESVELKYTSQRATAAGDRTDFELLLLQRAGAS